ncbi:MAG: cyanoexosortase A system-associated protein [Cyanobacteria bacterium]|nr:cyanoexosortase A system-associated protein [Cyanobacteriota bacterium]MDW8202921.1 cyanoexosortase A system-associated protein [Cyanobacteriota bacterium SKYGB_h_bin112]
MVKTIPRDRGLQLSLLAMVAALALVALGRSLLQGNSKSPVTTSKLPTTVVLPGWTLIDVQPLKLNSDQQDRATLDEAEKPSEIATAQTYRFQRNGTTLEANTYYIAPATEGNVNRYVFVYSPLKSVNTSIQERQQPAVGNYGVLAHAGRAYITACTTNLGPSTFTEQQFTQNRSRQDLRLKPMMLWLIGQRQDLLDLRCLWTLMSVPIAGGANASPDAVEQAYQQLESVWVLWHQWWQQHFPPLRPR